MSRRRVQFDGDESSGADTEEAVELEPPVRSALRRRETKLELGRSTLLDLLTRAEREHEVDIAKFEGAINGLSEEIAAAHTAIRTLRGDRDKLRAELVEATRQIDTWEMRAAKERDRASVSLNAVEAGKDRAAGLERLLELSKNHEKETVTRLLESQSATRELELRLASMEADLHAERELHEATKQKFTRSQEAQADALERLESIRQDRKTADAVLDLNKTLTRHVACAVQANQELANALMRFDGLRDCVRPVLGCPVAGLYEFDAELFQMYTEAAARERARLYMPHDAVAESHRRRVPTPSPKPVARPAKADTQPLGRQSSGANLAASVVDAGPAAASRGPEATRRPSEGFAKSSTHTQPTSAGADGGLQRTASASASAAKRNDAAAAGDRIVATDIDVWYPCTQQPARSREVLEQPGRRRSSTKVRGQDGAAAAGPTVVDAGKPRSRSKHRSTSQPATSRVCQRKLCCVPSCCLADDKLRVCIHTPSKTVIL
jgi:hypothetical protein